MLNVVYAILCGTALCMSLLLVATYWLLDRLHVLLALAGFFFTTALFVALVAMGFDEATRFYEAVVKTVLLSLATYFQFRRFRRLRERT